MGIAYHTLYAADGTTANVADRWYFGTVTATYASAGAGLTSTVVVTWTEPIPGPYCAVMSPVEDCTWYMTSKTSTGFTLNVWPRLLANALAGGTVEILIVS